MAYRYYWEIHSVYQPRGETEWQTPLNNPSSMMMSGMYDIGLGSLLRSDGIYSLNLVFPTFVDDEYQLNYQRLDPPEIPTATPTSAPTATPTQTPTATPTQTPTASFTPIPPVTDGSDVFLPLIIGKNGD